MLKTEFEQLTKIFVSDDYYSFVEKAYMDSPYDKIKFCQKYKKNETGIAEKIRNDFVKATVQRERENKKEKDFLKKQLADKVAEIELLKSKLEREQEWAPYDDGLFSDEDYKKLSVSCQSFLSPYEAQMFIAKEFGFDCDCIRVLNEKKVYEINRHCQIREVGKVHRRPCYFASDYYYLLFECRGITYEVVNGTLKPYAL